MPAELTPSCARPGRGARLGRAARRAAGARAPGRLDGTRDRRRAARWRRADGRDASSPTERPSPCSCRRPSPAPASSLLALLADRPVARLVVEAWLLKSDVRAARARCSGRGGARRRSARATWTRRGGAAQPVQPRRDHARRRAARGRDHRVGGGERVRQLRRAAAAATSSSGCRARSSIARSTPSTRCIGYRGRFEYLGKASARLDDLLNLRAGAAHRGAAAASPAAGRAATCGARGACSARDARPHREPERRTSDGGDGGAARRRAREARRLPARRRARAARGRDDRPTRGGSTHRAPRSAMVAARARPRTPALRHAAALRARARRGRAARARRHRRRASSPRSGSMRATILDVQHQRQSLRSGAGGRAAPCARRRSSAIRIRSRERARARRSRDACAHGRGARRRSATAPTELLWTLARLLLAPATRCCRASPRSPSCAPRRRRRVRASSTGGPRSAAGFAADLAAIARRARAHARRVRVAVRAREPERRRRCRARDSRSSRRRSTTWRSCSTSPSSRSSERHAELRVPLARQRRVRAQPHQGARDPGRTRRLPARAPGLAARHRVRRARRGRSARWRRRRRSPRAAPARFVAATPPPRCSPSATALVEALRALGYRAAAVVDAFFLVPVRDAAALRAPLADAALACWCATARSFGLPRHVRVAARGGDDARRIVAAFAAEADGARRAGGARHEPHAHAHRDRRGLPDPPAGAGGARRRGRRRAIGRVLSAGRAAARRRARRVRPRCSRATFRTACSRCWSRPCSPLLTGALHLDGVADTFDALGAPGADRARRLEILRDSRIGAHGATALLFVVASRGDRAARGARRRARIAPLLVFPVVARMLAVLVVMLFPYARPSGLGLAFHRPRAAARRARRGGLHRRRPAARGRRGAAGGGGRGRAGPALRATGRAPAGRRHRRRVRGRDRALPGRVPGAWLAAS